MKRTTLIAVAAILTACGAAATSADNSAAAHQNAQRGDEEQRKLDAYLKEAVEMESAVQNGGVPGCFDPSLSGRERAVAERLGGVPCEGGSTPTPSGGDSWVGHYTGGGKHTSGDLRITRTDAAGYSVAFEIGGAGCGGGVEGVGHASVNRMTMSVPVQSGYQQCRIVMDRQGPTLRVSQSGDCYLFYGGQCSFDGTFARERSASTAPQTRTVTGPPARATARNASWIVGGWTIRGEPCGGFGTTFNANGTYSTDSERGTWTLAGNVLTVVTRATFELGQEDVTLHRNAQPVRSTVLSSDARAFSFRDSDGKVWNMVRCE